MLSLLRTRIGIALAIAIVIIGISLTIKYKNTAVSSSKSGSAIAIKNLINETLDKDDDLDGLKNWEEALYETDPAKWDSDDDGIRDGDESFENPFDTENQTGSTTEVKFTATDRLSQELFKEYVEAKKTGQSIDQSVTDRIAESVLSQDYSDIKLPYSGADVKLLANPTPASLKIYGNALGKTLSAPPVKGDHELVIFQNLANSPVEPYIPQLEAQKARYEKILVEIMSIAAPKELASSHADIANAISLLIAAVQGATEIETDPVGSLAKIAAYEYAIELFNKAISVHDLYFRSRNVLFSSGEPGEIFSE
jgi:hypothetical protein